jgi:DUF4097 and DUF4098 domain-containing protein YvlB
MRRSSIVAPLLLIGIGALFLARNLYPELPLLDYLARYWPFLLILWGTLRLAEVLMLSASDKPLPSRGVSGGEWVLVIFLCLVGASVHAVRGVSTWWPHTGIALGGLDMFGESFEYPMSGEKPCSKTPKVVIESFRGNARITGVDADSVKVTGHRTVRSLDQNGADRANAGSPFELAGDANQITVRNNQDHAAANVRLSADMEIMVPRGASIEAHGRNGDFDITEINGNVEIISDNAGVRLQNIGGDARIDLRRSDVVRATGVKGAFDLKGRGADIDLQNIDGQVTINGTYSGVIQLRNLSKPLRFNGQQTDLSIEKLPGQVRMALGDFTASNLVGPITLTTRSKDVQISDFTNSLTLSVERGDLELRPEKLPLARIEAQTRSGDIELSIPPAGKLDLTARTERGDATNDFGAPFSVENNGRGSTVKGSVAGGPAVSVHTERGTVVVRKASVDDKPLTPRGNEMKPDTPLPVKPLKKLDQ